MGEKALGAAWDKEFKKQLSYVLESGMLIEPTKDPCIEVIGHSFSIENGRDRLTINPARNLDLPGAVGQWLWTMAGRMDLEPVKYYNENAEQFSVDEYRMHGAYGPRLFGIGVYNQIPNLIEMIKKRGSTRRAVAVIYLPQFDRYRINQGKKEDEVPCTVSMQFLPREGKLHALTYMRSQNVPVLLPTDLFMFTMIQEYVAASTNLEVGRYHHHAGSFHIYEKHVEWSKNISSEATSDYPLMPSLPAGDQSKNLKQVIKLEEEIRQAGQSARDATGKKKINVNQFLHRARGLPDYWMWVIHVLLAKATIEGTQKEGFLEVRKKIHPSLEIFFDRMQESYFGKTLHQFSSSHSK